MRGSLVKSFRKVLSVPTKRVLPLGATRLFCQKTAEPVPVTLVPGDGIGAEIANSVVGIFHSLKVPVDFDRFDDVDQIKDGEDLINSIARNKVALKGVFLTQRDGPESLNVRIRKALDLYAGTTKVKSLSGIPCRFDEPLDFAIIRENTEAEYSGQENIVAPGVHQSLKIVTDKACTRIARFAFQFAQEKGRKKVTAVHKANIQKMADGLFLACCRKVKDEFPGITYEEMIVDNASMQLVMKPHQFDVVVTTNLYGAILSNLAAGLVGGPGIVPGTVTGSNGHKIFEPGARHVGMDIAGKNLANPVAMVLASVMMLRHIGLDKYADSIEKATLSAITEGKALSKDLGGKASTTDITQAIIDRLEF